jgi:pimeloyl-ACP methyl ester carboxylesterase
MVSERRIEVPGAGTRLLEVAGPRPEHPVLLFHGNPSNAGDWEPFLRRLEGQRRAIAPDLPGWGKADRPAGFRFTMEGLARWTEDLIELLGVERFDLVAHDWGSIALIAAARRPQSVGRVALMNVVPLNPDYRWHWVARLWRRRGVGELVNSTLSRPGTRLILRQAVRRRDAIPELAARIHEQLDRGTRRAILELYRDADPEKFAPIARDLAKIVAPVLVYWGDADPYIQPRFADLLAAALGGEARVAHLADAGHWPWLDRPEVVDGVCEFLG